MASCSDRKRVLGCPSARQCGERTGRGVGLGGAAGAGSPSRTPGADAAGRPERPADLASALRAGPASAGVAAATTARRAPGSRVTSSRPWSSPMTAPASWHTSMRSQVVPRRERGVGPHHEGVERAVGHRTQLQRGGAEGPELGPPEMPTRHARDGHDRLRAAPRNPRARRASSPARHLHPARRGSRTPLARFATTATRGPSSSSTQMLEAYHGNAPGRRWWSRRRDRSPPPAATSGTVHPALLGDHADPRLLEHLEDGPVGGEVDGVLPGPFPRGRQSWTGARATGTASTTRWHSARSTSSSTHRTIPAPARPDGAPRPSR